MFQRLTTASACIGLLLGLSWFECGAGSHILYASEKEPARAGANIGDKVAFDPAVRRSLGKQATVLVFLGTGCPVSNAYIPHLNEFAKKYEPQGVRFIGVNANAQDSAADVVKHAKDYAIGFPVLKDDAQRLADALGAQRVPEAVVIDAQQKIRYRGRIDDRYGVTSRKDKATREDLAVALTEVLAGKPVSVARTEVSGCLIGRGESQSTQPITFTSQVARIIQQKCQSCHRTDGVAPFALGNYNETKAWAKTIKEVIVERRMPPWHADPRHGKFANDRSLTQAQIDTLVAWIDGGTSKGDDKDLPPPIDFPKGKWTIGTPDVVMAIPKEFTVSAQGVLPYQDFVVETNFKEDRWVERAQVLPGSKAVHHAVVFLQGPGDQWLCTYVPGDSPLILPEGTAKKIPAGAKLRFNLHYTPTGKVEHDRTELGLIFAKQPPKQEIRYHLLDKKDIRIPAGAANHREEKDFPIPQDMRVLSFFPHMHTRGKSWECRILSSDNRTETVLSVPRYDFNWQHTYRNAEPLLIPAGSRIRCIAHYNNSKENPANPDPTKTVQWGPQTWDEMMVCGLEYVVDIGTNTKPNGGAVGNGLPREHLLRAARFLSAESAKLSDLPIKAEVEAEKASAVTAGQRAVLVLPDKQLARDTLRGAGRGITPVGHLWLRDWTLVADGKAAATDKLRVVTVSAGGQNLRLVLCLLGVRQNAEGALELVIYAKDQEPFLILPLRKTEAQHDLPIMVATRKGDKGQEATLNLFGVYETVLRLAPQAP
jgi:thiol-disulfide isomerase/thioredoxin